jgi:hypothetical protein
LAPAIVEAILDGRLAAMTLAVLMGPFGVGWDRPRTRTEELMGEMAVLASELSQAGLSFHHPARIDRRLGNVG